jgi:hypothetical protein
VWCRWGSWIDASWPGNTPYIFSIEDPFNAGAVRFESDLEHTEYCPAARRCVLLPLLLPYVLSCALEEDAFNAGAVVQGGALQPVHMCCDCYFAVAFSAKQTPSTQVQLYCTAHTGWCPVACRFVLLSQLRLLLLLLPYIFSIEDPWNAGAVTLFSTDKVVSCSL